jgi:hypothetical protein
MKWNGAQKMSFEGVKTETLIENEGVMLERGIAQSISITLPENFSSKEKGKYLIYGVCAYPDYIKASLGGTDETILAYPGGDAYSNAFYGEISSAEIKEDSDGKKTITLSLTYNKKDSLYSDSCPTTFNVAYSYDNSFEFEPGKDVGYIYTDFCPTSDLIGNAG